MMEWLTGGWGIIGLILAVIVLFNIGLIYALLSGSAAAQWDMLRRIASRSRNPWQREDEALRELHERAKRLGGDPDARVDEAG